MSSNRKAKPRIPTIEEWVNGGRWRSVEIQSHVNGVRMTLYENRDTITFSTESTVDEAFAQCMKMYSAAMKNHKQRELERLRRRREQAETDLDDVSRELALLGG